MTCPRCLAHRSHRCHTRSWLICAYQRSRCALASANQQGTCLNTLTHRMAAHWPRPLLYLAALPSLQHDNGMRRAYAGIPAAHRPNGSGNGVSAARPLLRRPSSGALHKDPSLATLLLGEVAEVC